MEKYWQQATKWWYAWQELSRARKLALSSGCMICLVCAGVAWWLYQPEYRVLYSGLSAEEAGAITSKLQSKGIAYKLTAGGSTVLVPTDQAMQAVVDLAADGVPGASKIDKGFDKLFDQPMLGATPTHMHINLIRAQQAELARTIMQIDPIIFARVHITRPEPSPFLREQKPTTASVMVKLRPGAALHRNTVAGIGALVAGSVEGLTKENVRIVDAQGRLLSDNYDGEVGMAGSFIEKRKEVEQYLSGEIERVLTAVLGPGRAIVRVTAELNLQQIHEKKEVIHGEARVPRSEQITIKKVTPAGGSKAAGTVGFPPFAGKSVPGPAGATTNEDIQKIDYAVPISVQELHHKFGSIERLTIAAFVDTSSVSSEKAITIADIQDMIKNGVGFKADRDEIKVTEVRMPAVSTESAEKEWENQHQMQTVLTIVRNGSIALGVLCLVVMAIVVWWRWAGRVKPPTDQAATVASELERNPEMLAELLSRWMDRSVESTKRAA
jgi:flagellar M-ring protein FliF